ncbi:hypothetical protein N7470_007272 [Penicillium chermesinum]|nr:hypothetical protein N7470_007272 [Penicillium chermesinum]
MMLRSCGLQTLRSAPRPSLAAPLKESCGKRWAQACYSTQAQRKPNEVDVIVVGSGCSGLTAALAAAKHGLDVLVLEKTQYFGGTTATSGGGMWLPNNKYQPIMGITDSTEKADEYLQNLLGPLYDQQKIAAFLKSAPEMLEWLEANSHMQFQPVPAPDYHQSRPGASVGRTLLTKGSFDGRQLGNLIKDVRYPIQGVAVFGSMQADWTLLPILSNPLGSVSNFMASVRILSRYAFDLIRWGKGTVMMNGNALVGRLLASLQTEGVQLWNNVPAQGPILDNGRVVGLKVLRDGQELSVHARKGVVLASGGFGRSPEAKNYVPHEWCAAPRGNTGDGKRIGVESGGALPAKNPENAVFAPISLLEVPGQPTRRFPHFFDRAKPGSIFVDTNGKRFANESAPYQNFVAAMHEKGIEKAFYIADHTYLRKYGMGMAFPAPYPIGKLLRQKYLLSAPTIAELAGRIGVPKENLEKTIAQFNSFAETGKDLEYHRGRSPMTASMVTPLWPRIPVWGPHDLWPVNKYRCPGGGCKGEAIPGLYAVGCDQNQVFKGVCPGAGSSIGPGMTFGYRAGLKLAGKN